MSTRYELDIITSLRIDYFDKSRMDYFEVGAINEKKKPGTAGIPAQHGYIN